MRALAKNRNFTLLWAGEMFSEVGSQMTTIAMPLLVLALTGSPAKAGLVGFARTLAYPLVALPAGVLADRINRRALMAACAAGRLVAIGSVPLALALGRPPLGQLMAVALIDAALFTMAMVAERGLLGEIVAPEAFADAIAYNEGRSAAGYTAGPPLGGALFGIARGLPFIADAVSFAGVLAALAAIRVGPRRRRAANPDHGPGLRGAAREAREGMSWLWAQPFLRAGALLYAAANLSAGGIELLGILVARHHGASPAAIGGAYALVGVGAILGAVVAGPVRRRVSTRVGVLGETWVEALLTPGLFVVHAPLLIGVLIGAMLVPMTVSSSIIVGTRLTLTPDRLRGRVQASSGLISSSLAWLAPLSIGVLFQYTGETATVAVASGWMLLVAVGSTLSRSLRAAPTLPAAES